MASPSLSTGSSTQQVECRHGIPAKVSVVRKGINAGRSFLGCPYWQDRTKDCGFFKWESSDAFPYNNTMYDLQSNLQKTISRNVELIEENHALKSELIKSSAVNANLCEKNMSLIRRNNILTFIMICS
ncbi:uncharacterized protein LOC110733267 [Chenopodium quinoa]|uniref:uncharacterized protein LOC110733267 n=1 Tax=Chenopodium quinoa TaxID=63459 RepID=UPI000B780F2F|nr:uncharacterized protein LOC110733267 [Chenopodium quinoa]